MERTVYLAWRYWGGDGDEPELVGLFSSRDMAANACVPNSNSLRDYEIEEWHVDEPDNRRRRSWRGTDDGTWVEE